MRNKNKQTSDEQKTKYEIIWLEQSAIQSIISDTFSLGMLGALFWFNYNFIGGSYFVNFIIFLLAVTKVIAFIKGKKRKTISEVRVYLDELEGINK